MLCGKRRQRLGARLFSDVVLGIHELENFRRRAQRLLKIVVEQRKLSHRIVSLNTATMKARNVPAVKTW